MAVMGFIRPKETSKNVEQKSLIVPKNYTHSFAVGQTGCGKTSSFIYPNLNDRVEHGHGIIFFDHKGKENKAVKYFAHKHNRLDDVIEIGVPWGITINLIKNFNEKKIRSFVVSLMAMKSEHDYWSTSASNLVSGIWKTVKAYENIIKEADNINLKKSYLGTVVRFKLPTVLTFTEIANICKSTASIASFLNKVQKLSERFGKNINAKIEDWSERHDELVVNNKYLDLMTSFLDFKNIVDTELKSLEIFKDALTDNNRSSTFQTMILSMSSTFSSISDNKVFNDPNGLDLAQELDAGKIIVINSQEISDVVLSNLTSSTLEELSKRVGQTNIQPVSCFIDEAQRVLGGSSNGSMDLHTDILRESFTEILISFQSYALMNNALGESHFKALILNLVSSYHFKNAVVVDNLETDKLDIFECYINAEDNICTSKAIFLDKNEVFDTEVEYFDLHGIYHQLNIDRENRDKVIQFNPALYQRGLINLVSRDGTIKTIKLRNIDKELESRSVIHKIIKEHEATLKHKREANPDYETLTAAMRADNKNLNDFMSLPGSSSNA